MGLQTNVGKTVGMVCRPCQSSGTQPEVASAIRMAGEGPIYQERQRGRLQCKKFRKEMALGSMVGYMRMQHGMAVEGGRSWSAISLGD